MAINCKRVGGLHPIKQKHFIRDEEKIESFHHAPAKHGFYCFPEHKVELFLLTSSRNKTSKYQQLMDRKEKLRKFKVDGYIWVHIAHMDNCKKYVKKKFGSWQLIHTKDYKAVCKKYYAYTMKYYNQSYIKNFCRKEGDREELISMSYDRRLVFLEDKDPYEIFVPKGTKVS